MMILVLTDEEIKAMRTALRLMYLNGPDLITKALITKIEKKNVST